MKNKVLILILSVLLVISSSASAIGIIEHNKKDEEVKPEVKKKEITYEYYLEDSLVNEIPNKETDDDGNELYKFSKYQCDNNVTGTFNEEEWTFTPDEVKAATCKIYFVKTFYDVDITVSNAKVDENNPKTIEREGDGVFYIIPNDGYEFSEVTCANNKEVKYDPSSNKLTINAISEDVACKVDFEIKASEIYPTERRSYGDSISLIVTPNSEYKLKNEKKLTCTNDQTATFDEKNNTLTISKLTSDTACTIEFEKEIVKYKLTLTLDGVKLTNGTLETDVLAKDSKEIIVEIDDGFEITEEAKSKSISCENNVRPDITIIDTKTVKYFFGSITSNTKCSIKATKKEEVTTQPDESTE